MTTTQQQRVTGFCPCCDQPMWADQYADRGFRVRSEAGVCSECPTDGVAAARQVPSGNVTDRSDQVVGHWAAVQSSGVTMKTAAAQLGLTYAAYWQAVQRAREAGDSRAEYAPRAGVSTQRESGPDWDRILSRWDHELRPAGLDYRQAADAVGVPVSTFENRLRAARNEGDSRAAKRVGARETAQRDTSGATASVAGTEWVWTARGWEAPEDVETERKVETVTEQSDEPRGTEANPWEAHEVEPAPAYGNDIGQLRYDRPWELGEIRATAVVNENDGLTYVDETEERRDQLVTWHADDQAEQAAGAAEVAL